MELRAEDITVSILGKDIVRQMNLLVEDGCFCGLIGPNGSGKTTFLKAVYRVLKARKGIIFLDNRPLQKYTGRQLAREMAVVGQFNQMNFSYSVMDIVLMGRTPHLSLLEREKEEDRVLAREALEKVGMEAYGERDYQSLSGGEKQRVILARALTQHPRLLVLDEPTNHLDIRYQLEVLSLIRELRISVLTALHDLNLAAEYCDYIYMMKEGQVAAGGTPWEVITRENVQKVFEIDCDIFDSPVNGKRMVQYRSLAHKTNSIHTHN